jgi:Fic family protein
MVNSRIGSYKNHPISNESYQSYIPHKLPPQPNIDLSKLSLKLEKANQAIGELNAIARNVPNSSLFVYMYIREEALLSSRIEGTQSSFSDLLLFENHQKPDIAIDDVEEVSNYVKALTYGLDQIKATDGLPLSLRLLCDIHGILLQGTRGRSKQPGEFRTTQNWIGGTRPGNALFVPPAPEHLMEYLGELENFIHNRDLDNLIAIGLVHTQFETIHPFLDGNGRLGRLLITLMLCERDIIIEPILYLSLYLKKNHQLYYDLLQRVRTDGCYEVWLEFFLDGIWYSAKQAVSTINQLNFLFEEDLAKIKSLGRMQYSCIKIWEYIKKLPQVTVPSLVKVNDLGMTAPTIRNCLEMLVKEGILIETTGLQRYKIYVYKKYLSALEEGTNTSMFEQSQIIQRVEKRGGIKFPWKVDLRGHVARIEGIIEISFYVLGQKEFSIANYRRIDTDPDITRDQHLIEEAIFMIAKELKLFNL